MLSGRTASSRLVTGVVLVSVVAVVVGLIVVASPALRAQGAPAATGEGASAGPSAPAEAAPTTPEAAATGQEGAEPEATAGEAPKAAEPAEKPKPAEIKVAGREKVDPELAVFLADLARRTSPLDKAEMIENERIWYRNVRQYGLNALPPHKDLGAECGSAWWSDYCGN